MTQAASGGLYFEGHTIAYSEDIIRFPEPHWVKADEGARHDLSRSGDILCAVLPTSHGLWSFMSAYMRGQCETEAGAKVAAVKYLQPEDPLDGLDSEPRDLVEQILVRYGELGPEAGGRLLERVSEIMGINSDVVVSFKDVVRSRD